MEVEYVYIISNQGGSKSQELNYLCVSYENAIKSLYNNYMRHYSDFLENTFREHWTVYLYRFPINTEFNKSGQGWYSAKMTSNSAFRVQFKTWGDLIDQYNMIIRDDIIDDILTQSC